MRKTIHFREYAVLALLVFGSWRLACYPQPFLSVPALCLAWVCLDEGHQRLTAQRQGTLGDVLLDLEGAVAATLAVCEVSGRLTARPSDSGARSRTTGELEKPFQLRQGGAAEEPGFESPRNRISNRSSRRALVHCPLKVLYCAWRGDSPVRATGSPNTFCFRIGGLRA